MTGSLELWTRRPAFLSHFKLFNVMPVPVSRIAEPGHHDFFLSDAGTLSWVGSE